MDWNIDNFNKKLEESTGYNFNKQRQSSTFIPYEHETLGTYIIRLERASEELNEISNQAHIYGKRMWYTHKTPSQCWICEHNNIVSYAIELFQQILDLQPSHKSLTFEQTKFGLRLTQP